MTKWMIEGFRGNESTGFVRQVISGESKATLLLERLACRHLTDEEVIEATFGGRADLGVQRDKRPGVPLILTTTGTDYHYVARVVGP
jgi:hypothetical protein